MHELKYIIIFKLVFKVLVSTTCRSAWGADKVFQLKGFVSFSVQLFRWLCTSIQIQLCYLEFMFLDE